MNDKENLKSLLSEINFASVSTEEEFENSIDLLAQYLLFGTPWQETVLKDPKSRRRVPILNDIPLVCKAKDCPYYAKCPIMKQLKSDAEQATLVGTECRADKIYAIEEFAAFVNDLQIEPSQTTDIVNVASLVRQLIYKRRIDWTLAIEGILDREPKVIDQKSGQVYWSKVVHPLLKVSEQVDKQISQLQKQLMADRQARAALAASMGRSGSDVLKGLFSGQLLELDSSNPIEAEFTDYTEEKET